MNDDKNNDEQNIDGFIDYDDDNYLEGVDSNYEQEDSFNKDIAKLYEDHKKNAGKATEMQNYQRPISKYQRNQQDGRETQEQENKEQNDFSSINVQDLISRFNAFIKKNKISRNEFCDNQEIFLDINDFKELFRKIHFVITNNEAYALFNYNNSSIDEGFILGKTFFDSHRLEWKELSLDKIDTEYDLKKINEEFKALQDEVFNIVSLEAKSGGNTRPVTSVNKRGVGSAKSGPIRPITALTGPNKNNNFGNKSGFNFDEMSSINKTNYNKQTMIKFLADSTKKKQAEEEMLRLTIEKRNKEFEKDCIKKMTEANQLSEELKKNVAFSAFTSDNETKTIMCKVFDKSKNETYTIDLKQFLINYRMLKKTQKLKQNYEYYKPNEKIEVIDSKKPVQGKGSNSGSPERYDAKFSRADRQKQIKEVLISSIRLKMKLKKQLKALKDKKVIDESIITANLRLTNLDDEYH